MSAFPTRRLHVGTWSINAAVGGHGRPILFLHGLGMSWEWWRHTMGDLCDQFAVCAVDLPGWGESSAMVPPESDEAYHELVAGIAESVGFDKPVIVGHSLGGYVAVRAARARASAMAGLLLVAPGGFGQIANVWLRLLSFPGVGELALQTGELGSRIFLRSVVHNRAAISPELLDLVATARGRRTEFLRQLRMGMHLGRTTAAYLIPTPISLATPVQLLWGRHDHVLPAVMADRAQEALHSGPPEIFEMSGHLPHIEEPEHFKTAVEAFCARVW